MWSHRRIDCEYRAAHTFAQHNCLCMRAISDIPRTCDWSHTHTPTHTHPRNIPDEVGDAGAHHNDVELFAGLRHAGVLVRRNGDDARIATTDDAVVTAMTRRPTDDSRQQRADWPGRRRRRAGTDDDDAAQRVKNAHTHTHTRALTISTEWGWCVLACAVLSSLRDSQESTYTHTHTHTQHNTHTHREMHVLLRWVGFEKWVMQTKIEPLAIKLTINMV